MLALTMKRLSTPGVEILDQLDFDADADPSENINRMMDVLTKLDNYFDPHRNLIYEWYVFMSMNQSDCEPIDMFVKRLKLQANKCEFAE